MVTDKSLISKTDLVNLKRLTQMIKVLNDELFIIHPDVRARVIGAATPALTERAFTSYDD